MMTDFPLVSVYMPTKNRRKLLERAINSIQSQSYPAIEIIVVDDGSTDDTSSFLAELQSRFDNITVLRNEQSTGACVARNRAIAIAKGEYITGLDDDDEFLPNRIQSLMDAYKDEYAFVCSAMWWDYGKRKRLIDANEQIITLAQQLDYNEATTQVFTKTERLRSLGGFDESFVACQDYDFWTRLIINFGSAYRIAEPSYVINDTGSSERMIGNPKSVKGYQQFSDKHGHLMSDCNKLNQEFMVTRRKRTRLTLLQLFRQIGTGHLKSKVRYFLSSNFSFAKSLHQKWYKKSTD